MSVPTKPTPSIVNRPLAEQVGRAAWMAQLISELVSSIDREILSPVSSDDFSNNAIEKWKADWWPIMKLLENAEDKAAALRDNLLRILSAAVMPEDTAQDRLDAIAAAIDGEEPKAATADPENPPAFDTRPFVGMRVECFPTGSSGVQGTVVSFGIGALAVRLDEDAEGGFKAGDIAPCKFSDVHAILCLDGKAVSE